MGLIMKKIGILVAVAATVALAFSCTAGNGWVRVKGNKFIDPKGKELVL